MQITCSAEKGVLDTQKCLACSLAGENPCGYDYAVLENMFADSQHEARKNEIHVTDLTGCIRKAWYDKTQASAEYPHEMLTRWLGTKIHAAVEGVLASDPGEGRVHNQRVGRADVAARVAHGGEAAQADARKVVIEAVVLRDQAL